MQNLFVETISQALLLCSAKIGTGNDVTLTSSGAQTATCGVNAGTDVRLGHDDTTETFSTSNKDEVWR